jgi:hypothetical protein
MRIERAADRAQIGFAVAKMRILECQARKRTYRVIGQRNARTIVQGKPDTDGAKPKPL